MSLGWLKTENLTWNNVLGSEQSGTWDYKVPMHKDLPKTLNITLNKAAPEFENGELKHSKRFFSETIFIDLFRTINRQEE